MLRFCCWRLLASWLIDLFLLFAGHYVAPASERVRFILGAINEKDENEKDNHDRHELFTELEEFVTYDDGEEEWKETARW